MSSKLHTLKLVNCTTKIGSGATPTGGKSAYLETGSFALIRSQNILNEGFSRNGLAFIDEIQADKLNNAEVLTGDVLLNITGDSVARVCLVPDGVLPARVNQHVAIIRPDPKYLDNRFLKYYLLSEKQQNLMLSYAAVGATRNALTKGMIEQFEILCPSIAEQIKIANHLSDIDKRIDLLKETNKTLESIAQAIFKSWFVDFDPVHAKQQGKECAGIDKATADLFPNSFVESKLGLIPKDWEVGVLGDLLTPKRGKTITKSACIAGDVPVVAGGLEPAYFHNKSNVKGPVITISASGANAGFVRLYQEDVFASDCTYISSEQTDEIFFWYMFLKYNQEKIYFMQQGAAQPHIYASDLMRLNVCFLKNNALQSIFNTFIAPIFKRIGRANRQIDILSNLRDTLLPRLISGKLDLSKIEKQLEGVT